MGKYGKTITDAYQEVLEWTVTAHELQEKKKVSKREIKDLENDNEHGMVALKLAQSFGTPKEVKKIQDINKRHQRAGEIESKDQKERDAIARKYYNMAEVYEIGTKEYADHTKNMTPGQTIDEAQKDIEFARAALTKANIKHVAKQHPMKRSKIIVNVSRKDYKAAEKALGKEFSSQGDNIMLGILESTDLDEGKMKDIVTDVKDALGKIRHRVSQKSSKFIVSVDSNDEEDAQKAMKNHPLYVAGKLRVIPEETELDESKFYLFDNEKDARDYAKKIKGKYVKGTGKSAGQHAVVKEEVELDEAMKYTHAVVDPEGKVAGMSTNEKDAKDIASRHKGKVVMLKKPMSQKKGDMMVNRPFKEETELDEDAMVIDLDYSKNPKGIYNAVLQMSKRLGLTIYNAPQAMKDLQTKGKVRLGGKGANLVKFMKYLNDKGIEPSVDVQKGKMKEELELTEKVSKDLAIKILSMNKNQKFAKISGDFVPEIYLSSSDKDSLKKEFGRLPRGLPSASSGTPVVDFINYALGLDNEIDTEGDGNAPKLYDYRKGKVIGKPKTVGDAARIAGVRLTEKKLTDAEMKKREEIAKAIEKDNPDMPMDKKMAIATATAKRVAEEEEPDKPDTAKKVDQMRDDKKKTRIAQLQLQIAKATETINKLNTQEK